MDWDELYWFLSCLFWGVYFEVYLLYVHNLWHSISRRISYLFTTTTEATREGTMLVAHRQLHPSKFKHNALRRYSVHRQCCHFRGFCLFGLTRYWCFWLFGTFWWVGHGLHTQPFLYCLFFYLNADDYDQAITRSEGNSTHERWNRWVVLLGVWVGHKTHIEEEFQKEKENKWLRPKKRRNGKQTKTKEN